MIIRKGTKAKLVRVDGDRDDPIVTFWSRFIGSVGVLIADANIAEVGIGTDDFIEVEFPGSEGSSFPATLNEIEIVPA